MNAMVKFRWNDAWGVDEKYLSLKREFPVPDEKLKSQIEVEYFDRNGKFRKVSGYLAFISNKDVEGRTSPYLIVAGKETRYELHLRGKEKVAISIEVPISQIRDFRRIRDTEKSAEDFRKAA